MSTPTGSVPEPLDSSTPAALERAVDRYLRHLVIERGLSANSVAAYRRDLGRYRRYLESRDIREPADIDAGTAQEFVGHLRTPREQGGDGLAASSTNRVVSAVRGFHRFLDDEGLVEADATADLHGPALPARLPKALSVEETRLLIEAAGGQPGADAPAQLRDRALLEVLYASGMRISEAVDLDVDDVQAADAEDGFIRVTGKGAKQRLVPLGSYARAAIDAYLVRARPGFAARGAGSPALFLGERGGRLRRQTAWRILQQAAARADLAAHVSPHTLRHCFATHLLQGGADVRVVQELLGHASVSTTQIYTKVTADALRDMYLTSHPRAR